MKFRPMNWLMTLQLYSLVGSGLITLLITLMIFQGYHNPDLSQTVNVIIASLICWLNLSFAFVGMAAFAVTRLDRIKLMIAANLNQVLLAVTCLSSDLISEKIGYVLISGSTVAQVALMTLMTMSYLQISGDLPRRLAAAMAASIGIFASVMFLTQSWIRLATIEVYVRFLAQSLLLILPMIGIASLLWSHRHLKTFEALKESFLSRFRRTQDTTTDILSVVINCAGHGVVLLASLSISQFDIASSSLLALDFCFIAIALQVTRSAESGRDEADKQTMTASLASYAGRRFLMRHLSSKPFWAATAGLRSPNFTINHDPDYKVTQMLPASLLQIRNAEIQRCVNELLGHAYLNQKVAGPSISGTVDPEMSIRPCIDLLTAFACLHLDAIPLVERRLSGLMRLLPIIDPKLSNSLNQPEIRHILSRNLWLFHFDYMWIDQQIMKTPRETHYGVQNLDLHANTKSEIASYLQRRNQIGSFIWLSDAARERVIFEAPILASIIHSIQVKLDSGEEFVAFTIRFEELIPRLQTYFQLDRKRIILKDFEASAESHRFVSIINLQTQHAQTIDQLLQVMTYLCTYTWHGYKEKDRALQTAVQIYDKANQIAQKLPHQIDKDTAFQNIRETLIRVITQIGYPSQALHDAQQHKFAMRQAESVLSNARQRWHPRYHEAWIILATAESRSYRDEEQAQFIAFLKTVPDHTGLARDPFVIGKAIEALANIGHRLRDAESRQNVVECFNRYIMWLHHIGAPPDFFARLIDAAAYVSQFFQTPIFDEGSKKMVSEMIARAQQSDATAIHKAEISSLQSRWLALGLDHQKKAS